MDGFAGGPSLRLKFTAAFVVIVIGGTVLSTAIGNAIITETLRDQARQRVRYGLEVTRMIHEERLNGLEKALSWITASEPVLEAARARDPRRISEALARARAQGGLDFLGHLDGRTGLVTRAGSDAPAPAPRRLDGLAQALAGERLAWTGVLSSEDLAFESAALAERARIPVETAAGAAAPGEITSGLVLLAAVPLDAGDGATDALYGGVLLNRNASTVDRVKELMFGGERHHGRDVGSVSIFMDDVRIATSLPDAAGGRALGARVAPEVAEAVLRRGGSWNDRVFAAGEWRVAGYEPIRDRSGAIVGMLCLGMLEAPLMAERTRVMLTFLAVALVGVLVVLGLTYVITGSMIRPLEQMVDATQRISAGELDLSVRVTSRDEIGHLAVSFNTMLQSLRTTKRELQDWGHTLEEKVRERTAELVAVQARMAHSEKLASIGRLAAGVAHEINNPLGGVLSLAMLALEERERDDPMREDLEIIVKQTLRCREIVKGLLDFSRQSESRATCVHVNPIVENTLSLLERQALFQNIRTSRRLAGGLPQVFVDPGQMQQVVMNIVINAVDAMEQSGELSIETAHDPAAGQVAIHIGDTGKGIPDDVLPFIFEPFFTTKPVGQGTGLGLAIVHGIVTRAGGRIEVRSSAAGTTFTIRLPVATEEAMLATADGEEAHA